MLDTNGYPTHPIANLGLLFYRIGEFADGRKLYDASIAAAKKDGHHIAAAQAATINCREAILFRTPWAKESLEAAHKAAKLVSSPGINFYLRKLDELIKSPENVGRILTPESAKRFSLPKTVPDPLKGLRLEHTATGPVLLIPRRIIKS